MIFIMCRRVAVISDYKLNVEKHCVVVVCHHNTNRAEKLFGTESRRNYRIFSNWHKGDTYGCKNKTSVGCLLFMFNTSFQS